jgi:hypothetical protein
MMPEGQSDDASRRITQPRGGEPRRLQHPPRPLAWSDHAASPGFRASDVLLIFDKLLDHRERCATHGAGELAVRPKCWQACSQHLKFLPKHTRCPTLDAPHQPMDAELRIPVEQQMHMIWHHFHFDQARLGFVAHVLDQFLQTDVYRRHENRAPLFREEHHMVFAREQHVPVSSEFRHRTLYSKLMYNNQEALTP